MYHLNYALREFCSRLATHHTTPASHRPLLVESLEQRCLLTTLILEESFKSPTFSVDGTFEGTTEIPSTGYEDAYAGDTLSTGQMVYTSASHGQGNVEFDGTGTGVDNCWPYGFQFHGFATLADDQGALSQLDVSFDLFEYMSQPIPVCAGGGPVFVDDDVVGTFATDDFEATLSWNTPVENGLSTGSWSGEVVFSGDPLDIQPTASEFERDQDTMVLNWVEFEFVVTGQPTPSLSHTTPVATVDVFWADGPTAADTMEGPIAQVPIYWNQAGGRVRVTDFGDLPAPSTATHLLVIADADNQVAEHDETNNVLSVGVGLPWHNIAHPCDVVPDSLIVPLDAHVIITDLNENGSRKLPLPPVAMPQYYLDVTGDGWVAPNDALWVINERNRLLNSGEGESSAAALGVVEKADDNALQPFVSIGLELDRSAADVLSTGPIDAKQVVDRVAAVDAAMLEYLLSDPNEDQVMFEDLTAGQVASQEIMDVFAFDSLFMLE